MFADLPRSTTYYDEGIRAIRAARQESAAQLKQTEDKLDKNRMRKRDKADKATVDDCLDERTMTVMNKLLDNEKLSEFGGCIATGKEANVYSGQGSWDFETRQPFEPDENYDIPVKDYAIKIFKSGEGNNKVESIF